MQKMKENVCYLDRNAQRLTLNAERFLYCALSIKH